MPAAFCHDGLQSLATRAGGKILRGAHTVLVLKPDDIFENAGSLRLGLDMSSPITLGKPGVAQ